MSQTPTGGEGAIRGATGILGVNNLQKAIDSFDRTVGVLQTIAQKWSQGASGYQAGQKAAGSWNTASNWAGGSNGGNATFGGTPFNPNTKTGAPGGAGGAHRAAGPAAYASTGGGGGAHRGAGNGMGKAAFAYGMASSALSGINAATSQSKESGNSDSMLYLTTANAMNTGQGVSAATTAQTVYGSRGWGYRSGQDAASANYSMFQNSGGPGMFTRMQQASAVQGLASPMMTGAQRASFTNSLYSVPGMVALHRVGIDTVGRGGSRQTPLQIANQILGQVDPQQTIRDPADIQRLINDPMSNLRMTLGNWVAGGVITGDQVQPILDNVQTILKARSHGTDFNQLQTLMNNYKPGNSAAKTLAGMQIGNSAVQDVQSLDASKRERTINGLNGFEKGLEASTNALTGFNNFLNGMLNNTGISGVLGMVHGSTANGKFGGLLGAASMLNPAGLFGMSSSIGSASVGVGKSLLGEGASLMGIGGNNESRMSVNAQAAGSGGGTAGGSSGGASSGSIRMAWPCNPHPLGEGFGASGSRWASGKHTGQDIEVPTGTPVMAAAAGTVNFSGADGSYGNAVHIDHGGGVWTLYGHNSRLVARVGQKVNAGTLISYSGATGNVTGPHLHFEVRLGRDSYYNAVNPLPYLTGSATISGSGSASGGTGGTTGSGASMGNGSGTSYSGVGSSELDVLGGGSSGGSMGSVSTGASGSAGSSSGSGSPVSSGGSGSQSKAHNMSTVLNAAAQYGWNKGAEWSSLADLVAAESSWNNTAQNPTSTAYGLFQFLDSTWKSYGSKTSNPDLQAAYGLKYIKSRYGDPIHAWNFHKAHNWYDKGAWEIQQDEDARVHKGEMIVQKPAADQIRQILMNGNPYGAMGNQHKGGEKVVLQFNEGAIKITLQGSGNDSNTARALGKGFVDQVMADSRIQNLQKGVLPV